MPVFSRIAILFGLCLSTCAAQLAITNDTGSHLVLKAEDLAGMTRRTATVTEHNGDKATYEGVPLQEVLKRAGAPSGKDLHGKVLTTYILATAHDGYQVVFSLGEVDATFGNASILVADKRDGQALPEGQGPLRLVCSDDKAGARSVRMLEKLDLVRLSK